MDSTEVARNAGDITNPRLGLRSVVELRKLTDALELLQVEAALTAGLSWLEIADALGVSRQAVHKKYARRLGRQKERSS